MTERQTQTAAYWRAAFTIEEGDLDYLYNLLLEEETPLTTDEMAQAIIRRRIEREAEAAKRREQGAAVYLPKETYALGQTLMFPALQLAAGAVVGVRPGRNPDHGEFDVIAVDFGHGRPAREFAARFADHKLNEPVRPAGEEVKSPEALFAEYGREIGEKLEARLKANADIVRIAGRWFPRALLATIHIGHLNLAEAVLDMAGGGPLPVEALLKEVGLAANINPRLQAFSLNFALQEDPRFDEVGPAGQVLWYLRRLEPPEVVFSPRRLENAAPAYDRSKLTPTLAALEKEIEDELSPAVSEALPADEVEVMVTFPHRRVGTLPLSPRLEPLFPTAYESPRIRFILVDGDTGEKFPGWVVRAGRYVFGLDEWYKKYEFPVGGQLTVRRGEDAGEVVVKASRRRPVREWVRTAAPGPDGRLTFSMQKRPIGVTYDDLTIVAVDNLAAVDEVWLKSQAIPFERLVADVFRELAKLNPQSAVHAKTLHAAVNVARRSPPGPIFAELVSRPWYVHVGDAYWRFDQSLWAE
ncbi:MAG: hypothetical protein A2W37_16400 [Chloroflexi bacterium RBG_16_63_12]|nr:MAG: hypothetical protein A2W37_16400 [Chloroflexi bacterium RBG_16_63_12]